MEPARLGGNLLSSLDGTNMAPENGFEMVPGTIFIVRGSNGKGRGDAAGLASSSWASEASVPGDRTTADWIGCVGDLTGSVATREETKDCVRDVIATAGACLMIGPTTTSSVEDSLSRAAELLVTSSVGSEEDSSNKDMENLSGEEHT